MIGFSDFEPYGWFAYTRSSSVYIGSTKSRGVKQPFPHASLRIQTLSEYFCMINLSDRTGEREVKMRYLGKCSLWIIIIFEIAFIWRYW